MPSPVVKQPRLLRRSNQKPSQGPGLKPAVLIQPAKLCYRLLNYAAADPNAAHQSPIAMHLAILLPRRVAQVHAPCVSQLSAKENTQGWHYTTDSAQNPAQILDPIQRNLAKNPIRHTQLRKLG
ncbi:MAG: hypothetical protein IT562_04630 [Alphaproteobacteria bacterium]|nr:hypothetical protein [Alphaproteobacteria bacterium]